MPFNLLISLLFSLIGPAQVPATHVTLSNTLFAYDLSLFNFNEQGQHLRPRPLKQEADLNGIWVGELLQNPGGIAEKFEFSMHLNHNGIFMQGTSFVRHGEVWVEMKLSGYQQKNGAWKLTETKILRGQKPDDLAWCMKLMELRLSYTKEGLVLHGPWWGSSTFGPCIPGSVRLVKKEKTA